MPVTDYTPEEDYGTERDRIKRMLAQAEALRSKGDNMPQGHQLQGAVAGQPGFYVAPSPTQYAAPIVAQIMGLRREKEADQANRALSDRQQTGYDQWMAARPQTRNVQTSEEVPDTEAPGPMPEGQIGPLQKVRAVMQKQEPTRDEQIAWAGKGMKNPLSKGIAAAYMEDQIVKAPERDEARQFKADEAEKARMAKNDQMIAAHKNKLEELTLLSADKTKTRDQQLVIERMKDASRRAIASGEAQSRIDAATIKAKAAGATVKPVPNNVVTKMSEAEQAADGIQSAYTTFKPEYAGYLGAASSWAGRNMPSALSTDAMKEAAAWHQNYEDQGALIRRHALFGSAFTPGEQAAWDKATISSTTPPELVATYLKTRAELSNKFYNKLRDQYTKVGYGQVAEAFPERGGFEPAPGNEQEPIALTPQMRPTQPARRKTDLPPGVSRE